MQKTTRLTETSLLHHIGRLPHSRASFKQLIREFGAKGGARVTMEELLTKLADSGQLVELRGDQYVLVRGSRPAYAAALVVAGSAFIAVLLYRYVDIPALGPIPAMYEPLWFFEKVLSAVAEGLGAVLAGVGFLRQRGGARPRRR